MKIFSLTKLTLFALSLLILGFTDVTCAQKIKSAAIVVEAVAPTFPAVATLTGSEGKVLVHVKIDEDGTVQSMNFGDGLSIFKPVLNLAVQRWRFNAVKKNAGYRKASLSFIFRYVSSEAKPEELLPIFRPPYEIEIRAKRPIVTKVATGIGRKHR